MKSLVLSIALTLACFLSASAQFVTIPDANFVTYLQTNFPACMTGNQMDTTCAAITTAPIVNVNNKNIADLTGIEYFDGLLLLFAAQNQLTSLPRIPSNLINLTVHGNQLSTLPPLPGSMQILDISGNLFTTLPAFPPALTDLGIGNQVWTNIPALPATLELFNMQTCGQTTLPPLPAGLKNFVCGNNPLGTLPALPPTLEALAIGNVQLTTFPALPSTLTYLNVMDNNLTTIPSLPSSLTQLFCSGNNLVSLPALPPALDYLYCNDNALTSLPTLPSTLSDLTCDHNQLTSLPSLPAGLGRLVASYNQLTYLGTLPANLTGTDLAFNQITCFAPFPQPNNINLNVTNNPFTCIPNYPNFMSPAVGTIPICQPGNLYGCVNGEGIGGTVYDDLNADCIHNGIDPSATNVPVKLYDTGGTFIQGGSSHGTGAYFFTQTPGTWVVKVDTVGKPFRVTCAQPGLDSTVVLGTLVQGVDFEVDCKPGFDVGVVSVATNGIIFPGQPFDARIHAGDLSNIYGLHCATGIAGTVVVTYSGPATYVGPMPNALTPTVTGNTFTYTIPDFGLVNANTDFGLKFTTLTTATSADTMCFMVTVTPGSGDSDPGNNTLQSCMMVLNSFDPNAKEVFPMTVAPGYVGWLNYTIHFQNTGSAPAFNIRLEDTLDSNLDWETLEMISASHYQTWNLSGNALSIHFPNIMLPDSTTDLEGSKGYFQFRVKPKPGLGSATVIPNTAAIYFDFNAPVITNVATTAFDLVAGIKDAVAMDHQIAVYPNPSKGVFNVDCPATWKRVEWTVTNLMGQEVLRGDEANGHFAVNLGGAPAGFYLLKVHNGKQQVLRRVAKE